MKHVQLCSIQKDGIDTWRLKQLNGDFLEVFDLYFRQLSKKHPRNTVKSYCGALARFFDYLCEAAAIGDGYQDGVGWSKQSLRAALEHYPEWLVYGDRSASAYALAIAKKLPSPKIGRSSLETAASAIKKFLEMSEQMRQAQIDEQVIGRSDGEDRAIDPEPLTQNSLKKVSKREVEAIRRKSMLSGCLSLGPTAIAHWSYPALPAAQIDFDQDKAFPFDQASLLISSFKSARDKALYAFCAASGCRMHEALQLLWQDIDVTKRTVKLIDPRSRPNHESYASLTASERSKLAWKGRSTSETLLLQPFADLFFLHLHQYLKNDYIDHQRHAFVFQYTTADEPGRAYFLSSQESRWESFKAAQRRAGISGTYGAHSLRHMYGTYLVNYFPTSDGRRGLPLEMVKTLMGHASIETTEKYARYDKDILEAEIQTAFIHAIETGETNTVLHAKKEIYTAALAKIEKQIEDENHLRIGGTTS